MIDLENSLDCLAVNNYLFYQQKSSKNGTVHNTKSMNMRKNRHANIPVKQCDYWMDISKLNNKPADVDREYDCALKNVIKKYIRNI